MSVPYGYLVGLLLFVVAAVRLPRLPMGPGTAVFLATIAVLELPFLAVAVFAASTALAYVQGDLTSPVTIVAALVAGSCAVLTLWRGLRAPRVLQDAMGPTLMSTRLPLWRILSMPFAVRPREVERIANLSYGPAGKRNLLDVYRHRSAPQNAPVLIHFHGGFYTMGRKNTQARPLLHRLAARGWVCVSANYRFRPDASLEDHIIDVKRVVAWVRTHGADFGADPERIVLSGSSAGSHMSTMAALNPDQPEYQPGFEHVDTSVSAVVGLGGYWGHYFHRPETDPADLARPDAPPFLIVHGAGDTVADPADARRFADRLRAVSRQPVVHAELPGGQHGFDLFHSPRFEAVVNAVEAFTAAAFTAERSPQRTRRE
ncbi:alpha/beta hydrolase [Glycomyces sp. NPDC046736]|uniref:alpha/beta hydrolase n=1 Tax=Glycomyces sp. NPDC046736 TaxID=3155615 RepID=UPI0033CCC2BE